MKTTFHQFCTCTCRQYIFERMIKREPNFEKWITGKNSTMCRVQTCDLRQSRPKLLPTKLTMKLACVISETLWIRLFDWVWIRFKASQDELMSYVQLEKASAENARSHKFQSRMSPIFFQFCDFFEINIPLHYFVTVSISLTNIVHFMFTFSVHIIDNARTNGTLCDRLRFTCQIQYDFEDIENRICSIIITSIWNFHSSKEWL